MVSDDQQKIVAGDLAVETAQGTIKSKGAVIDLNKGEMTADSVSFTREDTSKKKQPNKAPEPTP
jgi:hypothetical protein